MKCASKQDVCERLLSCAESIGAWPEVKSMFSRLRLFTTANIAFLQTSALHQTKVNFTILFLSVSESH